MSALERTTITKHHARRVAATLLIVTCSAVEWLTAHGWKTVNTSTGIQAMVTMWLTCTPALPLHVYGRVVLQGLVANLRTSIKWIPGHFVDNIAMMALLMPYSSGISSGLCS